MRTKKTGETALFAKQRERPYFFVTSLRIAYPTFMGEHF
jgi:hypothetical protein